MMTTERYMAELTKGIHVRKASFINGLYLITTNKETGSGQGYTIKPGEYVSASLLAAVVDIFERLEKLENTTET